MEGFIKLHSLHFVFRATLLIHVKEIQLLQKLREQAKQVDAGNPNLNMN